MLADDAHAPANYRAAAAWGWQYFPAAARLPDGHLASIALGGAAIERFPGLPPMLRTGEVPPCPMTPSRAAGASFCARRRALHPAAARLAVAAFQYRCALTASRAQLSRRTVAARCTTHQWMPAPSGMSAAVSGPCGVHRGEPLKQARPPATASPSTTSFHTYTDDRDVGINGELQFITLLQQMRTYSKQRERRWKRGRVACSRASVHLCLSWSRPAHRRPAFLTHMQPSARTGSPTSSKLVADETTTARSCRTLDLHSLGKASGAWPPSRHTASPGWQASGTASTRTSTAPPSCSRATGGVRC